MTTLETLQLTSKMHHRFSYSIQTSSIEKGSSVAHEENILEIWALFSWAKFGDLATVVLLFLFGN